MKTLPFAEALALYPACVQTQVAARAITTNLALWMLGDEIEWSDFALAPDDPRRLAAADSIKLTKANLHLAAHDDLPGILEELQKRIGLEVKVGDTLAFDRTEAWSRSWGTLAPQGRLVARGPEFPEMAIPLAIEVKRMRVFPAWTLTRRAGVRLAKTGANLNA